jgi:DNA repair protein RecN (Recombination protein N)
METKLDSVPEILSRTSTAAATRTTVTALDAGARVEEIARMLGGEHVTEASRRHARELLRASRSAE